MTPSLSLHTVVVRAATTLDAKVDDEIVITSLANGLCYALNPVGAHIWRLTNQPVTIASICQALTVQYEVDAVTCESQVLTLVADLLKEGLIEVDRAGPADPLYTGLANET